MSCDLFVFAGEKSGDLHGEKILSSLNKKNPDLKIHGVCGPRMRTKNVTCIMQMEQFQVMGFIDVFLTLPQLIKKFYHVADQILALNPKTVLFIDYPGFNLRMAKHLRKKGFQGLLYHYICPSVWAWGKKRIPLMKANLNQLFTILPFEEKYFLPIETTANNNFQVTYVGNPLVQRIQEHTYHPNAPLQKALAEGKKIIAVFSGSRKKEIQRNLPLQLKVCKALAQKDPNLLFAISVSDEKYRPLIEKQTLSNDHILLIGADQTYELMAASYAAIAKSGTVTLELALHQVPTVVTYAISFLDFIIAYHLLRIRLPHYCLVNILASKEIFPELFGPYFTEESLFKKASDMIYSEEKRKTCQMLCSELKKNLGNKNAGEEVAKEILSK